MPAQSLSHVWLCDLLECSLPGPSVHGILQVRILEWIAIPFSRGSSQSRDRTYVSCIGRQILYPLSHLGSLIVACKWIHLQCGRPGFDPWVGKIPWRRAWQPTPVFLPRESPWMKEPGGLQSIGLQRVRHDWSDLECIHNALGPEWWHYSKENRWLELQNTTT